MTLVRPVGDEKALREIQNVTYENLRPQFRTKVELLVKKVLCNVRPKAIEGQPLTGEMFVGLLQQYVTAFNGGVVPSISTAWEQVLLLELEKVVNNAIEEYKNKVRKLSADRFPMSVEETKKIDEEAKKSAYKEFYGSGLVSVSPEKMTSARERMEIAFNEIYSDMCKENYNISYKDSEDFFQKLYSKVKEQMDQLEILTFDVVVTNWQKLRECYLENARGPAVYEVGEILTTRYLFEDMKRVCVSQRDSNDKQVAQLEKDIASANGIIQATKETFEEEKQKHEKELKEEIEKAHANRLKYEATIDELQRQLEKKNPGAVQEVIQKLAPQDAGEFSSGYYLKAILSELEEKKKENDSLSLKLEYEQKVRQIESEQADKLEALKAQMKHVFNLQLQSLRLTYEDQLAQKNCVIKDMKRENEIKKVELIKKESEISILKEKNRHFENERKMRLEHAEFLCRVFITCDNNLFSFLIQ